MSDNTKMPITGKGLRMLLMGLVVMVAGFVLMMGEEQLSRTISIGRCLISAGLWPRLL